MKRNMAASGMTETFEELEKLLDDVIIKIDKKKETSRAEKETKTGQDRQLVIAGQNIRNISLKRKVKDS